MRICHVGASQMQGGAGRAAYRLHSALRASGFDSQMLVQANSSDDFTVIGPDTKLQKALGIVRPTLDSLPVHRYHTRTKTLFSPSWLPFSRVVDRINCLNPDVVHLHWIAGGMMRIEDLAKIKAPIVWSLHDMWAFTGGCHYDEGCGKFKSVCGACPALGSDKSNDLSAKILVRKQKSFLKHPNLTLVALSRWLANEALDSSLFRQTPVINLPNPIDTATFAPFDKQQARNLLNLPVDKKLVVFGAIFATSDPRKGFNELSLALDRMESDNTELVVFGASKPKTSPIFKQRVHYLGVLHDDLSLRVLYSAADVVVVPSLQENLSNVVMESLACGSPVVAFDVGGNEDLIDHLNNGYLAQPFDVADFAAGIDWVLSNPNYMDLCQNAREKVLRNFDSHVVVEKYIELYESIQRAQR